MPNPPTGRPMPGASALKIGAERQGAANEQPAHGNEQGVLERAMANTQGAPAPGEMVNRSDERPIGTNLHADGTVEHVRHDVLEGSTADIQTGSPLFKQILSPTGDQREHITDMTLSSRVTLQNGMEMTADAAIKAGFIALDANGTFIPGPVDIEAEVKDQDKDKDLEDAGEFLPEADEAVMQDLIDNTSAQDQVSVIQDITSGDGQIDPNTIARAASEAGVEPSVMHGKVETVFNAMRDQASAAVAKHGVDAEEVWAWANEPANLPKLQAAVRKHAMTRSTASYADIAQEYIANLDTINPEAILNADFGGQGKAHRDDNGNIVITDSKGVTYKWSTAVKTGIIKLS